MNDCEFLDRYGRDGDQEAFAALVRRHGDWVYASARRQLGDAHLAEDVTQGVFLLLARKAARISARSNLGGWLFGTLRLCIKEARRQMVRHRQEQEAAKMSRDFRSSGTWEQVSPLLDEAIARLSKADREAVILRFYERMPLAAVGEALGTTEEAARKRVERAVVKLREALAAKGVETEAASLAGLLLAHAAEGMEDGPVGLVERVMAGMNGGVGNETAGAIAKGAGRMMVWAQVKVATIAVLVTAAIVVAGSATRPTTTPVLPAATVPTARGIGDGSLDPATFRRTGAEEKCRVVLALLRMRDAKLRDFAYDASEVSTNIHRSGKPEPMGEERFSLRRLDERHWMRLQKPSVDDRPSVDYTTNWDGRMARSLTVLSNAAIGPAGMIHAAEDSNFGYRAYNQILGFRMIDRTALLSLSQWLQAAIDRGTEIETDITEADGKALVTITAKLDRYLRRKFTFDVARDFMPVQHEYLYQNGESYNKDSMEVVEARQVDGFWVPAKVIRRTSSSAVADTETQIVYTVSSFSLGSVTDKDLQVSFPPGTRVVDAIERVAYRVTASGGREMLPLVQADGAIKAPAAGNEAKAVR